MAGPIARHGGHGRSAARRTSVEGRAVHADRRSRTSSCATATRTSSACASRICRAAGLSQATSAFNGAPAPIGSSHFRRHVPPSLPRIEGVPAPANPLAPPATLTITRPKVSYPTAVLHRCAGRGSAAARRCRPRSKPRLPAVRRRRAGHSRSRRRDGRDHRVRDRPALRLRERRQRRPAGAHASTRPRRPFPADPDDPLVVDLDWVDVHDATGIIAPAAGALPLPRAREVIITVRAVGREDAALDYFGSEAARLGDATSVSMFAAGRDEREFFVPDDDEPIASGACCLRPQEKDSTALQVRSKQSVASAKATRVRCTCLRRSSASRHPAARCGRSPAGACCSACTKNLAHVLAPDGSAVTFSAESDLTDRWLAVVTVGHPARLDVERRSAGVARNLTPGDRRRRASHVAAQRESGSVPGARDWRARRSIAHRRYIVFFDAVDPKPIPPAPPSEMSLTYVVTPGFRIPPAQSDPAADAVGRFADCRAADADRQGRLGWRDAVGCTRGRRTTRALTSARRCCGSSSTKPPTNPADGYFGRVLTYAPDPMLTREAPVQPPPDPPLPISSGVHPRDPAASVRRSRRSQRDAAAHADVVAAALRVAAAARARGDEPRSARLLRRTKSGSGTLVGWSTARARFGPPLRVAGVQHPAPHTQLRSVQDAGCGPRVRTVCDTGVRRPVAVAVVSRDDDVDRAVRAGHAGRRRGPSQHPVVAQAGADSAEARHQLRSVVAARRCRNGRQSEIELALASLGLPKSSPLSVLAVEMLPEAEPRARSTRHRPRLDAHSAIVTTGAGAAGLRAAAVSGVIAAIGDRRSAIEELSIIDRSDRLSRYRIGSAINRDRRDIESVRQSDRMGVLESPRCQVVKNCKKTRRVVMQILQRHSRGDRTGRPLARGDDLGGVQSAGVGATLAISGGMTPDELRTRLKAFAVQVDAFAAPLLASAATRNSADQLNREPVASAAASNHRAAGRARSRC